MTTLFNKHTSSRTTNPHLPLGDQLAKEIYISRSQKMDVHGEAGLTPEQEAILNSQEWVTTKKKVTKTLSIEGRAAVFYLYLNGAKYIDSGSITTYDQIGGLITELTVLSKRTVIRNDVEVPVYLKWQLTEEGYTLNRICETAGNWELVADEFTYPKGEVPLAVLKNNVDETSDLLFYGVHKLKEKINYWAKQVQAEWGNAGKSRPVHRSMYGDGKSQSEFAKQYSLDAETMKQAGINSKLAGDSAASGGAVNGVATAVQILSFYRQIFRDSVMLHNDTQSTGSNKHGLEIALSQQLAVDNILEQKKERDIKYTVFLSQFFGASVTISVNLSPITQAIVDDMALDMQLKQAQIAQTLGPIIPEEGE